MRFLSVILISLFLCSCTQESKMLLNDMTLLSLTDLSFDKTIKLSSFAESVEAIPLETTDESLIGEIKKVEYKNGPYYLRVTNGHMNGRILVVSDTGKFLYKIDKVGQGRGEYIDMGDFSLTSQSNIKVYAWNKVVTYDSIGNYLYESSIPYYAHDAIALTDDYYMMAHTSLRMGLNGYPLVVFNKKDEEQMKVLERSPIEVGKLGYFHGLNVFSSYNDKYFFNYSFCDTIFSLSNYRAKPLYYLDFGKYKVDYSDVNVDDKLMDIDKKVSRKEYVRLWGFQVRPNYLILSLGFNDKVSLCFYSLKTGSVMNGVSIMDDMYFKGCVFPLKYRNLPHTMIDYYLFCSVSPSLLLKAYEQSKKNMSSSQWQQFRMENEKLVSLCEQLTEEDNLVLLRIKIKN